MNHYLRWVILFMNKIACDIYNLEKAFGPNKVLKGIDLKLFSGEITVLMGANGAGKSTLVKILCGVHQPDSGKISLFGSPFTPEKPADAFRTGVVTVHQSINDGVIPDLDVASNLMLDQLNQKDFGFFVKDSLLRKRARKIAQNMKLEINMKTQVSELGIADRQLIAIARAMTRDPKVLILDEPTSSLSAKEAERLFTTLDTLKSQGVAILYISHRMSDIRRIADRIVSMRDGTISGVFDKKPLNFEGAVTAMLGHKMTDVSIKIPKEGKKVIELENLVLSEGSRAINLSIFENQVVAITGLIGSGKSKLASILFGASNPQGGSIKLGNKNYNPLSTKEAIKKGVHMCSKDRASNGVIKTFNIEKNISLPFLSDYSVGSLLRFSRLKEVARKKIDELGIVCQSEDDDIDTLSGGNQQKVMVGRWLIKDSELLILDEPFQGVDIQARRDIGSFIRKTAKGRGTIVFVAELDEALEIADRVIVMNNKAILGDHLNNNINLNKVLSEITSEVKL